MPPTPRPPSSHLAIGIVVGLACLIVLLPTGTSLAGQPVPLPEDTLNETSIDAGRLDAIMRGSETGLEASGALRSAGAREQRGQVVNLLVEAIVRYNANLVRACRQRAVSTTFCGGLYLPAWLKAPPRRDFSEAELRAMTDEAQARIVPFWSALCRMFKHTHKTNPMCETE